MLETILAVLVVVGLGVIALLWRGYATTYASEKGKNLATREDVAEITRLVEEVKSTYLTQAKTLEHQNAILLERLKGNQALRMAASEKRLAAHQQAFSLWRKLYFSVHRDDVWGVVLECQSWWDENCLYLSAEARDAFNRAYMAAGHHRELAQNRDAAEDIKKNFDVIRRAGDAIVAGAALPSLGVREAESAESRGAA
jgi:predicted acyl esterase